MSSTASRSRERSAPTRCPSPACGRTPTTSPCSRIGCTATSRRRSSTRRARSSRSSRALAPAGDRRMGANPHGNGGRLLRPLDIPDYSSYAVDVPRPGTVIQESTRRLGEMLRDIYVRNPESFRLFCPDETLSNRLGGVRSREPLLDGSDRAVRRPCAHDGRVMEVLSEHCCEGWLEGYLLSGRHGLFATYEAFAMVPVSMAVQHAKWLGECRSLRVAGAGGFAQRAAHVDVLAERPQRVQPSGPRLHRHHAVDAGQRRPRVPATGRELPAVGRRPLPGQS